MENGIEKRRHVRAPLTLSVVLKTLNGPVEGKTGDISISGLSIMLFEKKLAIDDEFEITIKLPSGYVMPITCKKAWFGKRMSNKNIYDAIGVHFERISPKDRSILMTLIEDYYLIRKYKMYYPELE